MKRYYIANNYREFREFAALNAYRISDEQYIRAGDKERLLGLKLKPEQIEIIGDPKCTWSFFVYLYTVVLEKGASA